MVILSLRAQRRNPAIIFDEQGSFMCIFACAKMVCRPASAVRPNHVIVA
jgi:hypothetical protein